MSHLGVILNVIEKYILTLSMLIGNKITDTTLVLKKKKEEEEDVFFFIFNLL